MSIELTSQNQAKIKLDVVDKYNYTTNSNKPAMVVGANVKATVKRADLDPSDKVRLVLVNDSFFQGNSNSGGIRSQSSETKQIDLKYVGNGEFAAPVGALDLSVNGYEGLTTTRQRVAVVINGEWQHDPRTNGDFNVDLYNTEPAPAPSPLPPNFSIGRYDGRTYLVFRNDSTSVPQNKILVNYKVGNEWKTARGEVVEGGGRGGYSSMKVFLGDNDIPPGTQLEMAIAFQKPDGSTEWLNKGFGKNFFVGT